MNDNQGSGPETKTVADRSTEFVAVEGGQETSNAAALLTTAYVLMWFFVFAFVWLTSRRLKSMQVRVHDLQLALQKADEATGFQQTPLPVGLADDAQS